VKGGIDLGGTKVQAVVVGDDFAVKGEARRPTPTAGGPGDVAAEVAAAVREAAKAAGVEASALSGVGVGAPGDVDSTRGTVATAGNLPNWRDPFPLGPVLQEALGTKVFLGNDVELAAEAEFRLGAGKPYSSLLGVFWGTGIGGGIVLDGKRWRGRGAAAEVGHVVIKLNGALCSCGGRGCVEAYAGRAAMEERARKLVSRGRETILFELMERKGRTRLTSSVWERALEKGDQLAIELIDRAVESLGAGIASVQSVLDAEVVVLGGGLGTRLGEPYRQRIEEAILPYLFTRDRPAPLVLAELGDLSGAIGAARLVQQQGAQVSAVT
jgi:glucokinase